MEWKNAGDEFPPKYKKVSWRTTDGTTGGYGTFTRNETKKEYIKGIEWLDESSPQFQSELKKQKQEFTKVCIQNIEAIFKLQSELEKAKELIESKDKELKVWQDMAIGFDESISMFKTMLENIQYDSVGLGCGIEDNNIHSRYEAGRYGFEDALDKVKECVPDLWQDTNETLTTFLEGSGNKTK